MTIDRALWIGEMTADLTENVLPFWRQWIFDGAHGGFIGARLQGGGIVDAPRSTVLAARIVWTLCTAAGAFPADEGLRADARRALTILRTRYPDADHGGYPWSIDAGGRPCDPRKHTYPHAFVIYALSAAYERFADPTLLDEAMSVFDLLQRHTLDPEQGGYVEGCGPDWGALADYRLSHKEPNVPKTMNSNLHVLEALTELLRQARRAGHPAVREVERAHAELIEITLERILDPVTGHCHLFFERDWTVIPGHVSYGHDIEAAWLLRRAAHLDGDSTRIARATEAAVRLVDRTVAVGFLPDGALADGGTPERITKDRVDWWPQAEAIVGLLDAAEVTQDPRYVELAHRSWRFVSERVIDRVDGDWIKTQTAQGQVDLGTPKIGPWECPYHHVRAMLEARQRLAGASF